MVEGLEGKNFPSGRSNRYLEKCKNVKCKNAKYFKVAKTATLFLYFQIVLAFLLRLLASTDGAWVKWSRMEQESIK